MRKMVTEGVTPQPCAIVVKGLMHRTVVLGLGVILGVVGPIFLIVGYQNSDAFVCTNIGMPNCFASGNNTTLAYDLEFMGMYMTAFGMLMVALGVLDNFHNKKTQVAAKPDI